MKWFIDTIFRKISDRVSEIEHALLLIEDEEHSASRYARQGAVISDERWESIEVRQNKLENEKDVLLFLKSQLHKHHNPRTSNKEKKYYYIVIEQEVIKPLSDKENFEGCLVVKEFIKEFIEQ
jgi:tRNA U38,U39,U40 pseudouridine synthase TruA